MLGVSQQPGNNPGSSLRHSASFSCLQRGSNGEGHRARTSTLPQQPSLQLGMSQYSGLSSLQHRQQMNGDNQGMATTDLSYLDTGEYGFVKSRPRLRSTNAILLREDQDVMSRSTSSYLGSAKNDRDNGLGMTSSYREPSGSQYHDPSDKSKNPLRGALILFTTSTSNWWKNRQRDDHLTNGSSSERKYVPLNGNSSLASPPQERRWPCTPQSSSSSSLVSPSKDTKRYGTSSMLTPVDQRRSTERKWNTPTSASSNQDRKWRSLGALLRTPLNTGGTTNGTSNQSRASQSSTVYHNASASMIEPCERPPLAADPSFGSSASAENGYYRCRLMSGSSSSGGNSSNHRTKVGRRLFQDDLVEPELDEDVRLRGSHHAQATRAARAQSFYLLDDFLRPQDQSNGSGITSATSNGTGVKNGFIDLYPSSNYKRSSEVSSRQQQLVTTNGTSVGSSGTRNVTNITPPRRHNSSSDSLEVATSPLPPPVPPPPPQINSLREREKIDRDWADKDCKCRQCWTGMQQRSYHEEVSFILFGSFLEVPDLGHCMTFPRTTCDLEEQILVSLLGWLMAQMIEI
ncbi:hypothetical protein QAD02_001255 [Eretmocerus hayati]|uniref:Uncharacterized protein n=1 Tax=Eretmocerus hayati TaxID=131215 RepID=A0ACC2NFY6_9HYME|nr:hypothetical protein QAD02_001255 [Eretmocerus hayati]